MFIAPEDYTEAVNEHTYIVSYAIISLDRGTWYEEQPIRLALQLFPIGDSYAT